MNPPAPARNRPLLVAGIVLLISSVVVPIVNSLLAFTVPPMFTATARIAVAATDPNAVATEMEIIRSKAVLVPVATNLNLARVWGEKYKQDGALPMDITYLLLSKQILIRQSRNTRVVDIMALSDAPTHAAAIANEIADVYTQSPLAAKDAEAKTGPQIIDQATPNFRGVRPGLLRNIVTGIGLGMLFGLVGLVLVLRGGNNCRSHPADHSESGATSGQLQSKPPPLTAP